MTDLGTLGGPTSVADDINDAGQVVGASWCPGDAVYNAFLWSGGVMTDLGTLGGSCSAATSINDAGQVVGGSCGHRGYEHAFLWSGGVMTDLGTLGGSYSYAYDINDVGQVVGTSWLPGDQHGHAFVWSGGVMTDLGTLDGSYSAATGINDAGQVVGYSTHAFLTCLPSDRPSVEVSKARMVSPTKLGVDLTVQYPPSDDPAAQRQFVRLDAVVNGTAISEDFDISALVEAGKEPKTISFNYGSVPPRVLDFARAHVQRFESNQDFLLTARAYTSDGQTSPPASVPVTIVLPVVIAPGYMGPGLLDNIFGRLFGPVVYDPLAEYLHDRWEGDFVTGYTTDDTWYKSIWLEYYDKSLSPEDAAEWLAKVVEKAHEATYAARVNLVCHSLGGLIARYYTSYTPRPPVHKLIMIGTPNQGSSKFYVETSDWSLKKVEHELQKQPLARWLAPLYDCLYECAAIACPGPTDWTLLTPDPSLLRPDNGPYPEEFLDNASLPEGVTYYSIYTTGDPTPYRLKAKTMTDPADGVWYSIEGDLELAPGDGTVPAISAQFPSAVNRPVDGAAKHHASLPADPQVQAEVWEALRDIDSATEVSVGTQGIAAARNSNAGGSGGAWTGKVDGHSAGESAGVRPVAGGTDRDRSMTLNVHPNPFHDSIAIRFRLPQRSPVRVAVYDVAGRLVRSIVDESRDPGWHETGWGGVDQMGVRMPGGVYFVQMMLPDGAKRPEVLRRVVLVR